MNIKALIKVILQRRFLSGLLLLQLGLTLGLIVNSVILALDTREKLLESTGLPLENLLVVESIPTAAKYENADFYRSIIDEDIMRLSQLDGVTSVAPLNQLPIQNGGWNRNFEDSEAPPDAPLNDPALENVSIYFSTAKAIDTFQLALLEGRKLTAADEVIDEDGEANILISESLAKAVYGEESAIGKLSNAGRIVGVIADMLNVPGRESGRQFFYFAAQPMTLHAFTQHYLLNVDARHMEQVKNKVENVILDVNPERDVLEVYTMADRHREFFADDTGLASLFAMLCVLMLIVTAISSFAHAQFHITKQKKFIGIRRALGAKRSDIMLYVLSENWLVTFVGGLLGIAFVIGFNVLLSEQISVSKPSVGLYFVAFSVIYVSSTLATWWPARQTSKIPPVIATRTV